MEKYFPSFCTRRKIPCKRFFLNDIFEIRIVSLEYINAIHAIYYNMES